MEPTIKFDRTVVTVLQDATVNVLVELTAPPAPELERPPIDVVCVIDKSGSMGGAPLESVKAAVAHLLRLAGPDDRIGVVAFDDSVELVLSLDHHDIDRATDRVAAITTGGMTNLSGGWLKGIEMLESHGRDDALCRVIVLTDGQANVGETNVDRLASIASGARSKDITTSTIGFGADHDERLLSLLADAGSGNDYWCAGPDQAPQVFNDEFEGLASVVAQNVSVELRPADGVVGVRVLNEFPITEVPGGLQIALGDAYGSEQRRVIAELLLPVVRDAGPFPLGEIVLRWASVGDDVQLHTVTIPIGVGASLDPDAPDPDADPEVIEQVTILRAAEERKQALESMDRGDFSTASTLLSSAADLLESIPGQETSVRELRHDSARAKRHDWDAASSKKNWAQSRQSSKGRKRRYDAGPDSGSGSGGPSMN